MEKKKTIEILEALVSGRSPKTGQIIGGYSVLNERDVIRALQIAIDELKISNTANIPERDNLDKKKTEKTDINLYREIDYFRKEKFNRMSLETITRLKKEINDLGISKSENLSEYIINARKNYPRAYEPWSEKEKELFIEAIKLTNDVDLLSECFKRGNGSIESFGQKLLYEA
jgi:FtsZ-binding cell division protein ZapB